MIDRADEIATATQLLRTRLAHAAWPRSALVTEAKSAGIGEAALSAALLATGARTINGRLTLNGHALEPVPVDEPVPDRCPDDRVVVRAARMWIRKTLEHGPQPEAAVERVLAEKGLCNFMLSAAEKLGVRCRGGQWWLP